MDWTAIKLCKKCGAGNPRTAWRCLRCGSWRLGRAKVPPPPTKTSWTDEEIEVEMLKTLCGCKCPQCGDAFTESSARDAKDSADKAAVLEIKEAKERGVHLAHLNPLYPLKCDSCQHEWNYDIIRRTLKKRE